MDHGRAATIVRRGSGITGGMVPRAQPGKAADSVVRGRRGPSRKIVRPTAQAAWPVKVMPASTCVSACRSDRHRRRRPCCHRIQRSLGDLEMKSPKSLLTFELHSRHSEGAVNNSTGSNATFGAWHAHHICIPENVTAGACVRACLKSKFSLTRIA